MLLHYERVYRLDMGLAGPVLMQDGGDEGVDGGVEYRWSLIVDR